MPRTGERTREFAEAGRQAGERPKDLVEPEELITAEQLVRPFSGKHHLHALRRRARQEHPRDLHASDHWIFGMPDRLWKQPDLVRAACRLVNVQIVIRKVVQQLLAPNLIEIGMLERKGERRDGALAQPVHQRNHGARVQARAQPRANGNVTHEVESNGFCELLAKRLRPLAGAPAPPIRSEVDVPVLVETRLALLIDEVVGRRYTANTCEHRPGRPHQTLHHQVGERGVVHSPLNGIRRENRFLFRAEVAARGRQCIMKRLDPESIPRQHEPLPVSIPQREAEHATKMPHALGPEVLVEMHDDFNIGMGVETMTARD